MSIMPGHERLASHVTTLTRREVQVCERRFRLNYHCYAGKPTLSETTGSDGVIRKELYVSSAILAGNPGRAAALYCFAEKS
jgi:hypothetical protein